jgi:opacity protein-like surface antigen
VGVSDRASAQSEESHSGDLLALRLIGGLSGVGDTAVNTTGTIIEKNSDDDVGAISVALGYDWSKKGMPFRSELEYSYRFRFDYDVRVSGGTDSDFENNVSTHSLMANFFYDFETGTRFTPFVGFGLGWVRNVADSEQTKLFGGAKQTREVATDNFGWSLHAGVLWRLGRDWRVEGAYRYVDLGEINVGPFGDGAIVQTASYTSHDVILGVLYAF